LYNVIYRCIIVKNIVTKLSLMDFKKENMILALKKASNSKIDCCLVDDYQ